LSVQIFLQEKKERSRMLPSNHKIDDIDRHLLSKYNWYVSNSGYAVATDYTDYQKTFLLHRLIMDAPQGLEVDHINHDKLDNRRSNLRIVTHKKNTQNRKYVLETVGVRYTSSRKWQARYGGKNLGSFLTYEEAKQARINHIKQNEQTQH
jgi:hypothetical protein